MLMRALTCAASSLMLHSCAPQWRSFEKSAMKPVETQKELLFKILRENADTQFGRHKGFSQIHSLPLYQKRVPLSVYEDYREYLDLMAGGGKNVLTADPVLCFEPSGGSTAPSKYVPYTDSLKKQFQKGIASWLYDMYAHRRKLMRGKSYWQITPAGRPEGGKIGAVTTGFEEDMEYLGALQKHLARFVQVVPAAVSLIQDMESFFYVTALFLLREKALSLISLWSPTFLLLILKSLQQWLPRLIRDIEKGTITPPSAINPGIQMRLLRHMAGDRRRAGELKALEVSSPPDFQKMWPELGLISCWGDGSSAHYLKEVTALFPHVEIQPKGLIATEAFISFPLTGHEGHVLSIESHFFEFLEHTGSGVSGRALCAWELEEGKTYSVVVTTGGGLYRYRMRDLVSVRGYYRKVPLICFLGREEGLSDMAGEKLNEAHVREVLRICFERHMLSPSFHMLAPETGSGGRAFYALFLELNPGERLENSESLLEAIEKGLQENFHFKYCRDLGQLDRLRLFLIESGEESALETYLSVCREKGQRLGDIKPAVLHSRPGWAKIFKGSYR